MLRAKVASELAGTLLWSVTKRSAVEVLDEAIGVYRELLANAGGGTDEHRRWAGSSASTCSTGGLARLPEEQNRAELCDRSGKVGADRLLSAGDRVGLLG